MRPDERLVTRPARADELDTAAGVLGEAFHDYPWTRWTVDPDDHVRRITSLQRLAMDYATTESGQVWITTVNGRIHAVANWSRRPSPDTGTTTTTTTTTTIGAVTDLQGTRAPAARAADEAIPDWAPRAAHLFLGAVGTLPASQRRGLARRTLEPMLARADHDGLPCFLETSTQGNVALYRGLGFDVIGHTRIEVADLDVWAMHRPPTPDT